MTKMSLSQEMMLPVRLPFTVQMRSAFSYYYYLKSEMVDGKQKIWY